MFHIVSLELKSRWYGYYREQQGAVEHIYTSPFVYRVTDDAETTYALDIPADHLADSRHYEAWAQPIPAHDGGAAVRAGGLRFQTFSSEKTINIPPCLIKPLSGTMLLSRVNYFQISCRGLPLFPEPIAADPGLVIKWPQENWREPQYEIFRWDSFPSILIFDTASYDVQDKLFKRLAFFVEKAGFRGRLAQDAEIAALHGWNAHDYRADDLARFFEMARIQNFPLLEQERALQKILLSAGILRCDSNGAISGGEGGLVSISRESRDYQRSLFMAHEGFHGLFFIDKDFRAFCQNRWVSLPGHAKVFIRSFFDFQRYDIHDETLMINEFMAHVLQQPSFGAAKYFGETLPRRLESSPWRVSALGEKDEATDSWPQLAKAFTQEAETFSAYVNRRWGLSAGRTWTLTVNRE
jgi:hypothetical protein